MRTPFQVSVHLLAGALALCGPAAVAAATPPHTVMTFTHDAAVAHKARRLALHRKELAQVVNPELAAGASPEVATAAIPVSLLSHLAYTPSTWNQGGCGDCWVWGSTAACSIGYGAHLGTSALFSVQYLNSTYSGGGGNSWACCGGDTALFASFYAAEKAFIPWSNAGGTYTDLYSYCGGNSATKASAISLKPAVPFTGITDQVIVTTGVTQAQAIANIKAVLNGGQAVAFGFFLPGAGWNDFESFWSNSPENTAWPDINSYSGSSFDSGAGGHITCLVGYDDSDATWIVLNSWGTTAGRPDGTFKIPQAMGYNDYMVYSGTEMDQFEFDVYDLTWPTTANTVTAAITAPAQGTTAASGAAVAFTGTGTDSSSQAALTYSWTFGDGASATGPTASHAYSNTGTATLTETVTLTATDATGAKGTATLTVYVAPVPRNTVTAAITSPAATVTVASGAAVSFAGSATDSSRSATLTYAWAFGDGASATGASASHAYTNNGAASVTETVTFTATDSTGISAQATRSVIVSPAPRNTVSAAITSPAATVTVASGAAVSFSGSATDSSRSATLTCAWAFGDGASATGASASHAYTNNGTASVNETVTLTATDSTGVTAQATRSVIVSPAPRNTVTAAITSPAATVTVASGAAVSFAGSATDSSKTATLTCAWAFGDGASATGASASHAYTNTGTASVTETVTFTAKDSTGISAQATRTVIVSPAPRNTVTAAIASPSSTVTVASGAVVSFTGSATDSSRTAAMTTAWAFGDGATGSGTSASHSYTNTGSTFITEIVTFTVSDPTGATAQATRLVLVNPAPRNTLTAAITNPPIVTMVGNGSTIAFTCAATDSSPSAALTYAWTFGDGASATGPSPSHKFACTGGSIVLDNVVLKVTDSTGVSATANTFVYVMPQAGNVVNVAVTSPSSAVTLASGAAQSFTCKGTDSSSSARLTYYWNFGDNICATGATVSHAYTNNGTAPVTLWVTVLAIDSTGSYGENVLPVIIAPAGAKK